MSKNDKGEGKILKKRKVKDHIEDHVQVKETTRVDQALEPSKKLKFTGTDMYNTEQHSHSKKTHTQLDIDDNVDSNNRTIPKPGKNSLNKKKLVETNDVDNGEGIEDAQTDETIDWPQNDLAELINNIQQVLPEKDNLVYATRVDKINWNEVCFNNYNAEDCKKTWLLIQKRIRRFRVLAEVLTDAKEWISKPWTNFYRGNKTKRHPAMPKRPLSVYMLYYLDKKDKLLADNPGIEMTELSKKIAEMYKTLSSAKRDKYMQLAAAEKKIYEVKIEEFYRLHPEVEKKVENHTNKTKEVKVKEVGPKKPLTPFGTYYEEQLKDFDSHLEIDRNTFKEQCKEKWKSMSDKKKLVWIDWALDKEAKYKDELKSYLLENPNFVASPVKAILTKDEKLLKERLAGKPIKPPNSAYSLFSRMMLQSNEIKKIAAKDRMKAIAEQWKNCTDAEKKHYKERTNHMMEQYKLDFATYLESLPEDKRQEELQSKMPKRKLKSANGEDDGTTHKKKKNKSDLSTENKEDEIMKVFNAQPPHPPENGFALFNKRYHGKVPVDTAWKNLSKLEKKEYEEEVHKLKQKYIKEYEKYLKALTKEQLNAFWHLKRKKDEKAAATIKSENNDTQDESSDSCDSESDSATESSNTEDQEE